VRNYLLAMTGMRMWIYFWVCLPIYVARSYVSLLLGDLGADPEGSRVWIAIVVEIVSVSVCAVVFFWLRRHHRRFSRNAKT
jgi:predicted Co/Zn/Cd cation transporter (cation efflux family)